MNLIEESFQNKEEKKTKKTMYIILIAIVLIFIIIICIMAYMMQLQKKALKLTLDGKTNPNLLNLLQFEEDGTIYAPIKDIAQYLGYQSYNGEYQNGFAETRSKCYIQNENEVANFTLGSTKIYKLDIASDSSDYEYVYSKKPIKAFNGVLYASSEAIEKAFNVSFQYNAQTNRITILTMPYLIQNYENKVLDFGYAELDDEFVNQKTVLQNMLIVKSADESGKYGVIDVEGNVILEAKYDSIKYLPYTGDFLVELNQKFGIMSSNKSTKVRIIYSSIDVLDSDAGLYLVKNEYNKYGVIDIKGNIKIYLENDEIGVDISKFGENDIKSKYILVNNLIPVRKDKYWALYDKYGNKVVDYKYDSFGYIVSASRGDDYNLLVIPNYNMLVACKDKKYTLINSNGQELFAPVADDIYMSITGGQKHYYIKANDVLRDAEQFLEQNGIKTTNYQEEEAQQSEEENNQGENNQQNNEQQNNQDENNPEENNQQQNNPEENNQQTEQQGGDNG